MIAIMTKYLPATELRPARIKAWTSIGHKIYRSVHTLPDSFNADQQHRAVAEELQRTMGWDIHDLTSGSCARFEVHVLVEKSKNIQVDPEQFKSLEKMAYYDESELRDSLKRRLEQIIGMLAIIKPKL